MIGRRVARATIGSHLLLVLAAVAHAGGGDGPLSAAARAVAEGRLGTALERLQEAFAGGYPTPADVYSDARFGPLRDDAETREAWRALMGRFVRESSIAMVPADEPGTPMLIRGKLVRFPGGTPVPDAVLELYHTDATGQYEPGKTIGRDRRSRLFCFVRTDAQGRFEVRTIKPAPYPGSSEGAAHVHYLVRADGYRSYAHDFRPYDHPRDPGERATALERGERFSVVHTEGATLVCDVTIPVEPLSE